MSRIKQSPVSKVIKRKGEPSPQGTRTTFQRSKVADNSPSLQVALISKQLSIELQQKDEIIRSLREQNLCMQNELMRLKSAKEKKSSSAMVKDYPVDEDQEINVIMEIRQKLENILDQNLKKSLSTIANISRDFFTVLKQDPNSNKKLQKQISSLEVSINKISENHLQEQFCKNLIEFKQALRKEREALKTSLQETINSSIKDVYQKQENILNKQMQLLSSLPHGLKQLKEATKKREEDYKNQVLFLQKRIISMGEEHRQVIDAQNLLIEQLRQGLAKITEIYNKQVQIPILNIRQIVEREIQHIRLEFRKMHENTTLNGMIVSLIKTLNNYTESKNLTNNAEMHDEIKKINDKLTIVNDQSIKTINQVRQLLKSNHQVTMDYNMLSKAHARELSIAHHRKEFEQINFEARYQKQKQYIVLLETYNKKLEQSVMRTQKQYGKAVYEEWKSIEAEYRGSEKELLTKLTTIETEIASARKEIIEIKKTAFEILQTQKSLTTLFEQFESEMVAIKSFKDQLFNFLENQLKFRQEINQQVEIFNKIFVQEYSKLSELQSLIPETSNQKRTEEISKQELCDALTFSIHTFNQFKQDYESLFKNKDRADSKFHKYLSLITQLQEEYSKNKKNKPEKVAIELNYESLKTHINSALLRVETLLGSTRSIKDIINKGMSNLKAELHLGVEQFQKICKFVKQSKLQDTIETAYQLFEGKNKMLLDISQFLSEFEGSKAKRGMLVQKQSLIKNN